MGVAVSAERASDGGDIAAFPGRGRVARPFGFALTDPGVRLSRTRLFPRMTRIELHVAPRGA